MATIPAPTGAGQPWQLNGSAAYSGTDLQLTGTAASAVGSAIYTGGPVVVDGLTLAFETECSGGTGADGIALLLLNPSQETTTSVGGSGGGVGYTGLAGAAFKIETWGSATDKGASWQFCATHNGTPTQEQYKVDTLGGIVDWTFAFTQTSAGKYTVVITKGGAAYATWTSVDVPDSALLGFSAATGSFVDNHYVRNFTGTFGTVSHPTGIAATTTFGSPTLTGGTTPNYLDQVLADSPQVYYRLGEAAGTTGSGSVRDASGNGKTGTPTGITFGTAGVADDPDTAASFLSASGSHIVSTYTLTDQAAFTVEFWARTAGVNGAFCSSNNGSFGLWYDSANRILCRFNIGGTVQSFASPTLTQGVWYHVAFTYDKTTNTVLLYVDGLVVASTTANSGNIGFSNAALDVGRDIWEGWTYSGALDEFALYTTALSSTRINAHYNAASSTAITRPRVRVPYLYAEQVVRTRPRVRIPYLYAEQVVKPRPRVRVPYLFAEQVLAKKPIPDGYYANALDAATADFETGIGQLQSPHWWNAVSQSSVVRYLTGTYSAKVDYTSAGQNDVYVSVGPDFGAGMQFGMVPGYKYTFSCWVYVAAGTDPSIKPYLEFYDEDGTGTDVSVGIAPTVQYSQWYRISVARTIRSSATATSIRLYMGAHGTTMSATGTIYVDKMMLDPTTSTAVSPWQPGGFQGYLVDVTATPAARQRGVTQANAISVPASTTAYVDMHSTAARTRGANGIATLYSASATPINVSGTAARTRAGSGAATKQIANDSLASAGLLTVASQPFLLSNGYTLEAGEPYGQQRSGWWKFVATSTGSYTVRTNVTNYYYLDTNIYAGPSSNPTFAQLTWVAGDQWSYSTYGNTYTFNVTAGVTYYIQLQSYYGYDVAGNIITTPPPATLSASATLTRQRLLQPVHQALTALPTSFAVTRTRSQLSAASASITFTATVTMSRTRPTTAVVTSQQRLIDTTTVLTRQHSLSTQGHTANPPINDSPFFALPLSGASGSLTFSDAAAALDGYDPALPDSVIDPVGSVWFSWIPPTQGAVTVTVPSGTGVDAFATSSDWIVPDAWGWYTDGYIKVYKVHIPTTMTEVLTWTAPALPAGDTTETFVLDFYRAWPGDVTADHFLGLNYDTGWSIGFDGVSTSNAFGAYPAGDYYFVAQQWANNYDASGAPLDPPIDWDPAVSFGTFTDRNGNPKPAPFTVTQQVLLGYSARPLTAPVGGGTNSASWVTRDGEIYAVRAYPLTSGAQAETLTLSWSSTVDAINTTVPQPTMTATPGNLQVNIAAEPAGATLSFSLYPSSTVIATAVTDPNGVASVQVPLSSLTDGSYQLQVTADNGRTALVPFSVAATVVTTAPDPTPPPPPPPIDPTPVARWQLQDPVTNATWTFPINPYQAESTMLPRNVNAKTAVAVAGQPILFEGGKRAKSWQFKGHLLTLADRTTLETWAAKPYRIYLTDDFGRTFIVKLLQAAMTPVRDNEHREHHTYTVAALLYGRAS